MDMAEKHKTTYEADSRPLADWFHLIALKKIALPEFQRFEVWDRGKVRAFLQSIVEGLPTGAILLLSSTKPLFKWRPVPEAPAPEDQPPDELVLDGQQRLTALWKSLTDAYSGVRYGVRVADLLTHTDPDSDPEEPYLVQPLPARPWMEQPSEWVRRGMIPIKILNPELDSKELRRWRREAAPDNHDLQDLIEEHVAELRDRFKTFNLPFIRLRTDDPEAALAVFIHTNTKVTALSPFDLVVAYFANPNVGVDLHELIKSLREDVPELNSFTQVDDLDLMRAAALMQGRRPTNKEILKLDGRRVKSDWERLIEGARRAFHFLREERVYTGDLLPTEAVIPVLIALWSEVATGGIEEGNARTLLRKYLWHAFFSDRYDAATSGRQFEDYKALRQILINMSSSVRVPAFEADHPIDPLRLEALVEARWPKYKDRLARAILLTTLRGECLDLHDGAPLNPINLKSREYHHVFPKAHLIDQGRSGADADRALNALLITRRTNRVIQAKAPEHYLREIADASRLGEEELLTRLKSHLVPVNEVLSGDYDAYLKARARLVAEGAKRLLEGEAWTPYV